MSRFTTLLFLLAGVVGLLACSPAHAGDGGKVRQVGDVIYTVPAGWSQSGGSGDARLRTDDDEKFPTRCEALIYPTVPKSDFDGDAEAFARERMKIDLAEMVKDDADTKVLEPVQVQRGTDGSRPFVSIARGIADGRTRIQIYHVYALPDRFALVRLEGPVGDEETAAATKAAVESVNAMIESLRFVGDAGTKPLLGPPTPGPLDGVWWGNAVENRYDGLSGSLKMVVKVASYTFRPDGRFARGVPDDGQAFDFDTLAMTDTAAVGNYAVKGDVIELHYADGDSDTLERQPDAEMIQDGNVRMRKARLPPDGFTFEGTQTFTHYSTFSTGLSSTGGVGGSHTWTYAKDGTFTHDKSVGVSGGFDEGGGFAGGSEDKAPGRYRVTNGHLETTEVGDDGEEQKDRTTILIFDNEPDPTILVGGREISLPDKKE